jgi:hypothetical protein
MQQGPNFVANAKRPSTIDSADLWNSTTSSRVNCAAACWYDIPLQMTAADVVVAVAT